MKAELKITFEDGSSKIIEIKKAIEIDCEHKRESISINQTKKGYFVMSFMKSIFEGKKFSNISITKDEPKTLI